MTAETDKFIIASFALWAGDFEFLEELLREFSPPQDTPSLQDRVESPVDIIRAAGALRLRQLWQKRGEFKKLIADYRMQGSEIVEQPDPLETLHLRATLWRVGEREFSMRAFLKDLAWQEELFGRAGREARRNRPPSPPTTALEPVRHPREEGSVTGLSVAWTVVGNPFMQVKLTDLGLLEVSALWIEPRLPETAEDVRTPLLQLLKTLDEPSTQ